MKKTNFMRIISMVLIGVLLIGTLVGIGVSADDNTTTAGTTTPTAKIVSNNVEYGETLKLKYAVKVTGMTDTQTLRVVLCDADGNVIGNTVSNGNEDVKGESLPTFTSENGVPAQNIATVFYAKAQILEGTNVVAESAVQSYSVLEYLWERLTVSQNVTDAQKSMYNALLTYAAAADVVINGVETSAISTATYVAVVENNAVVSAKMYQKGDKITSLSTSLTAGDGEQIVWTFDNGSKTTMTAEELTADGYTVTDKATVCTAAVVSTGDLSNTHKLVLGEANGFTNTTSYVTHTSTDGWSAENIACTTKNNVICLILNGKTTAKGKLTSPTLSTGISKLSFQYTNVFSEKNGVDLTIKISQNGVVVAEEQLDDDSVTQNTAETFTWTLDTAISGNFTIEIVNNSPTNNTSNKDRTAIWDITWVGYTEE